MELDPSLEELLKRLQDQFGKELWDKLSHDERVLLADTSGYIDFGYPVDLKRLSAFLSRKL